MLCVMAEATFTTCPTCRRRVDPADPTLIFGYAQHDVPDFGQQHDWIDGIRAYFHPGCFPGLPRYRKAPRPPA
jgi:hypothetical protein